MEENKKIFIIDDDANVRDLIKKYLEREGYAIEAFANAEEVLPRLPEGPDMFIIDIMMPGIDGYELCKKIRQDSQTPIIMVSAKDEEIDKILGLELGSDDYMAKPFSPRELVARVKTIFRRVSPTPNSAKSSQVIEIGDLKILQEERKILKDNTEIELTLKEFELLEFLALNRNKAFKREQLLDRIWGYDYYGDIRAVDDLVKRIRKKLYSVESILEIKTVWGYGYRVEG